LTGDMGNTFLVLFSSVAAVVVEPMDPGRDALRHDAGQGRRAVLGAGHELRKGKLLFQDLSTLLTILSNFTAARTAAWSSEDRHFQPNLPHMAIHATMMDAVRAAPE